MLTTKHPLGFVLIELMLAVTLGLLLVSVIMQIYLANIGNYRLQRSLNHIQQNAKTAMDILTAEIHQAGYIGCARLTRDFPLISYPPYTLTYNNKISSLHTDEIIIRHAHFLGSILTESMRDAAILSVSGSVRFASGDILIISDCKQAEIFQAKEVKNTHGRQIIFSTPLHHQYEQYAEVSHLDMNTYFIADTHRRYADGTPVYSLYVKDIDQRKSELVEGIQQMHIHSNLLGVSIDFTVVAPPIKKVWHLYAAR